MKSRCFPSLMAAQEWALIVNGTIQTFSLPKANGRGSKCQDSYFVVWN